MIITVDHASKIIKDTKILDNICMKLESGYVYGLKGKNGSGKTMLMRAICGLIHLTEGTVSIDGKIIGKDIDFPPSVGILLENPSFLDDYSGFENLRIIASVNKKLSDEDIYSVLEEVGLDPADKKKYKKYSLGMKQRLGIACAVMEKPRLIILDEPTNALDQEGVHLVSALIQNKMNQDTIMIIADHNGEELESWTDKIFSMESGRLEEY